MSQKKKKENLFQKDRPFPTKETAAKAQKEQLSLPSLSERRQNRTQRQCGDFLWIQEISQAWCIAKFDHDDRIPLCTLTSACRLWSTSSYVSITLRKGRREAYRRTQVLLLSHSQSSTWEEKCSQLPSLPCFSFNKESGAENFLKQTVTEFMLKGKAQAPFIKSNKSITKWTSGSVFYG